MIEAFIETVESLYPEYKWIARKLYGPADVEQFGDGARYLVNIYKDGESYLSAGSKLEYAFRGAFALASKGALNKS